MNKYLKYFIFAMVIALAFSPFMADAQNVFSTIQSKLMNTFNSVRSVVYIVGGFGLVVVGVQAVAGKIKWGWLIALSVGLAIVAIASQVVSYVTDEGGGSSDAVSYEGEWGDTLGN